jgi:flavin-binding protein dodecin
MLAPQSAILNHTTGSKDHILHVSCRFLIGGNENSIIPDLQVERSVVMSEGTYKIIELVGSSGVSWEDAAKNAVETASKTLKDLRIAEVKELDLKIEEGKVVAYRARLHLSFKYREKE